MDLSDSFAKPKRGARSARTRVTLQVGGTPAEATAVLAKFLRASKRRVKVGKKLGASELVKAERR
jgi:hypothetical protein